MELPAPRTAAHRRNGSISTVEWAKTVRDHENPPRNSSDSFRRPRRKSSISEDLFSDGGREAWLTVVGGFIIFVYTMGYAMSFGDFQEHYHQHNLKGLGLSKISWIGAVQSFFLSVTGVASGPLFDVYGPHVSNTVPKLLVSAKWRPIYFCVGTLYGIVMNGERTDVIIEAVLWPSAGLIFISIILTSISKSWWHFLITQGVICGIGLGLALTTALAAICQHFGRKRALATGLALEGFPLGGLLFSSLFKYLVNETHLGFGNAMVVIGLVILALSCIAPLFIHTRVTHGRRSLILWDIFRNPAFILTVIGNFLIQIVLMAPLAFLPSFAAELGYDKDIGFPVLAMMYICLCGSLIAGGPIADICGQYNTASGFAIITAIVIFCWAKVSSATALLVFVVFYATVSGILYTSISVAGSRIARDVSEIGMFVGLTNALAGCSSLIGSPVTGAIVDAAGGKYTSAIVFNGICMLLGAFTILAARFVYAGRNPIA